MKKNFAKVNMEQIEKLVQKVFFKLLAWVLPLGLLIVVWGYLVPMESESPSLVKTVGIAIAVVSFGLGYLLQWVLATLTKQKENKKDKEM